MNPSNGTDDVLLHGEVKSSYFWDDGSGINGDTGAPASGEPMQEGLFAAPSWPLGTEGYVTYNGERADFFIGDRGPGDPSNDCDVMLDLDGKTFAKLTGESWNDTDYTVSGGNGHIEVEYFITEWGDGNGTEGTPHPFQNPDVKCDSAVSPLPEPEEPEPEPEEAKQEEPKEEAPAEEPEESEEDTVAAADQEAPSPSAAEAPAVDPDTLANSVTGTETENQSPFDLASSDLPIVPGGITLAALTAVVLGAVAAKRAGAAAADRVTGRHRRPGRFAPRPTPGFWD